jgi:hypothetical protein
MGQVGRDQRVYGQVANHTASIEGLDQQGDCVNLSYARMGAFQQAKWQGLIHSRSPKSFSVRVSRQLRPGTDSQRIDFPYV